MDAPNILLVVFDTARADALEPYGAPAGASPTVTQLASRGAALSNVYSTASWTMPSHASMFTGRYSRELGLGQAPGSNPLMVRSLLEAQSSHMLPAVLQKAGYATHGISTNVWVSEASGFATGFDRFDDVGGERQMTLESVGLRSKLASAREAVSAKIDDGASVAGKVLRQSIDDWSGQPTFWFVNLVECHSPYMPPEPYNDLGMFQRLRVLREAREHLAMGAIWRSCIGEFDVPEDALERMRHLYAQSVRYMDDWLARTLEALDSKGILDDTLVIITSDHGENFGEGGLLAHAYSIDNRLIHVPFVAAGAGVHAEEGVYSLADVPRMIADITGVAGPWPERAGAGEIAIAQFDPPVHPTNPRAIEDALAGWGMEGDAEAYFRFTAEHTAATDGRYKLLLRDSREDLFDLEADPLELSPLAADHAGSLAARERLRAALADRSLIERVEAKPGEIAPSADPDEAERIEQQLKLLGYL